VSGSVWGGRPIREQLIACIADAIGGDADKSNAVVDALDAYLEEDPSSRTVPMTYTPPRAEDTLAELGKAKAVIAKLEAELAKLREIES